MDRLKTLVAPLLIATALYLVFFFPILSKNKAFWESDVYTKHYPVREFLRESILAKHQFPFWTERIFLGFPIYADMENEYLNPINVLSILLFGALGSFKVLHFATYLTGACAFYFLLRRWGMGLVEYIAAVLVYFFSFTHLNYLIYYHVVAITMLFPLNVLLCDLYIQNPKRKYLIWQAISVAYGIYWGHLQSTFLLGVLLVSYLTAFGGQVAIKRRVIYLFLVGLLAIGLSLPQLIPSFRLFLDSERTTGRISYVQGSLTPELTVSLLFPYIYSEWGYYYGKEVSVDYSYTELYHYVGITAAVLAFIYLGFFKRDKLYTFFYSLLWVFLVLGYLAYLPGLNTAAIPLISLFRYWPRAVMLLVFGLALVVAKIAHSVRTRSVTVRLQRKNIILLVLPLVYLIGLHFLNITNPAVQNVHASLARYRFDLLLKRDIAIWGGLAVLTAFLFIVARKPRVARFSHYLAIVLVLLLLVDYRYFGADILNLRIQRPNPDTGIYPEDASYGKRILQEGDLVNGMTGLRQNVNMPYGYSQQVSSTYNDFYNINHLGKSPKASLVSKDLREDLNLATLKKYGFTYIETQSNTYTLRDPEKLDITSEELIGQMLINLDGHRKFVLESPTSRLLQTTVRYDPNWRVRVNGKAVKPWVWDKLFVSIPIEKGVNVIELKYVPFDLIYGVVGGFAFSGFLLILIGRLEKR